MTWTARRAGAMAALVLLVAGILSHPARGQASVGPSPDYAAAIAELERFIAHEMTNKRLPALSIGLVDDQNIVWAKGFGGETTCFPLPTVEREGNPNVP